LAPAPTAVDTPDLRSRRISKFAQQFFAQSDFGFLLLNLAIGPGQETVGGLQLEALTLAFLVVDGDALGGYRLHRFDAVELAHPILLGEQGVTVLAAIDQRLFAARLTEMTVAALTAHQRGNGGQLAAAGNMVCIADVEFGTHHAVHAALV